MANIEKRVTKMCVAPFWITSEHSTIPTDTKHPSFGDAKRAYADHKWSVEEFFKRNPTKLKAIVPANVNTILWCTDRSNPKNHLTVLEDRPFIEGWNENVL